MRSWSWLGVAAGITLAAIAAVATVALVATPGQAMAIVDPAGPLSQIHVSRVSPLDCQVMYTGIGYSFPGSEADGEFWGNGNPASQNACGTYLRFGGTTYGPDVGGFSGGWNPGNPAPTEFTPATQVSSGTGSGLNPWTLTTTVTAGPTVQLVQTDQYVTGIAEYTTSMAVTNNGPPRAFTLYHAGDCYLTNSLVDPDSGYGYYNPDTHAAACTEVPYGTLGRVIGFVPVTPGADGEEAAWNLIWQRPGLGLSMGNACVCTSNIDNGAGLSWTFFLNTGQTATYQMRNVFSPDGLQPLESGDGGGPAPVVPTPEHGLPYPLDPKREMPRFELHPWPSGYAVLDPCDDLSVHFDASASWDLDGVVASWQWEFGDGQVASGAVVDHDYPGLGRWPGSLTVRDDSGASNTIFFTMRLEPCRDEPLTVHGDRSVTSPGTPVQACASAEGGKQQSYAYEAEWQKSDGTEAPMPDGATFDASQGCMDWTPGTYDLGSYCLQVTVRDGRNTASTCVEVEVRGGAREPVAEPKTPNESPTEAPILETEPPQKGGATEDAGAKAETAVDDPGVQQPTVASRPATGAFNPWWLLGLLVIPAAVGFLLLRRMRTAPQTPAEPGATAAA